MPRYSLRISGLPTCLTCSSIGPKLIRHLLTPLLMPLPIRGITRVTSATPQLIPAPSSMNIYRYRPLTHARQDALSAHRRDRTPQPLRCLAHINTRISGDSQFLGSPALPLLRRVPRLTTMRPRREMRPFAEATDRPSLAAASDLVSDISSATAISSAVQRLRFCRSTGLPAPNCRRAQFTPASVRPSRDAASRRDNDRSSATVNSSADLHPPATNDRLLLGLRAHRELTHCMRETTRRTTPRIRCGVQDDLQRLFTVQL